MMAGGMVSRSGGRMAVKKDASLAGDLGRLRADLRGESEAALMDGSSVEAMAGLTAVLRVD